LAVFIAQGCENAAGEAIRTETPPSATAASTDAAWLEGSVDERFAQVAKHLRGFDAAMVETGYRYVELYWAGTDGNWGYAEYQLGKIRTAIANGVERRPRRAQSASMLETPLQQMSAVIQARDRAAFKPAFAALTATCNACHQAEEVAFVTVRVPAHRLSPVRFPALRQDPAHFRDR
jgi:hypothetical protein